jgi:hypothetical protein
MGQLPVNIEDEPVGSQLEVSSMHIRTYPKSSVV